MANNVFGEKLASCSMQPVTGYYRDGCCNTNEQDLGTHTVCAIMTEEFLEFSKSRGNDLISPKPQYQFPGLQPGDRWCLCATRWKEAWMANKAPFVVLEATHEKTLEIIDLNILILYAYKSDRV